MGFGGMSSAVLLGCAVAASVVATPVAGVAGVGGGTPLAEAGLDQQVNVGERVRLDATGSYDPDGRVTGYEWVIRTPGGTTVSPLDPRAARTSFPATAAGRYEVTLTVTDDEGNAGTDTMYVRVETGAGNTDGGSAGSEPAGSTSGGVATVDAAEPGVDGATGASTSAAGSGCSPGARGPSGSNDGCQSTRGSSERPRVRIQGPPVVKAENSYTYTAVTGGLADRRSYEWEGGDVGREHTLRFRSGGEYTTRVAVTDADGRSVTDRLELYVARADNRRPEVEIEDPGPAEPGERVRLSVDAHDPDGRIRTTEWSPSRRVRVPAGSSRTVRVTVTDDDGASVTDVVTLTGRAGTAPRNDTRDVTCYFTDERQRDGRNPYSDRCVFENGNTASNSVGPSHIERLRENPKVDLDWQRTTEQRLDSLEGDDMGTEYGAPAGAPENVADRVGFSDDVAVPGTDGRIEVDNDETFRLDGRAVEDDLTGDGEVDAADWDQRYRTTGDLANVDPERDAVAAFKRSIRGDSGSGGDGDPFETAREATATTVAERFGGAATDASDPPDEVADLQHRELDGVDAGEDTDRSGSDGTEIDRSGTDRTDAGDGDHDRDTATDDADADRFSDGDDASGSTPDAPAGASRAVRADRSLGTGVGGVGRPTGGGTDDADRNSATGRNIGTGTAGPSTHDPHGGRVVVRL